MASEPKTLQRAITYFSDPTNCLNYVVARRWPSGVICPTCGNKAVTFLANQSRWQCKNRHPKSQFSCKIGTIFEDSPLGLDRWLVAMWLLVNCKNGISSYEIGRDLGISQKSAWHMLHRIRLAVQSGSFAKLDGEIEVDETFIGGKARNMHKRKRAEKITGCGPEGKAIVVSTEPFHLFRYIDEQAFRYNNRKDLTDSDRLDLAVRQIVGKRLTWAEVTG